MTDHTPGPWSVPHFARDDLACNCRYVLCEHFMGAICTIHCKEGSPEGDDPPLDEAKANARLIAAAPKMLAALQRIAADYENIHIKHVDFRVEAKLQADEAIAEAITASFPSTGSTP